MLVLIALLVLTVLAIVSLAWMGVRLLLAGRQLDQLAPEDPALVPVATKGTVAAKVDDRLQRTRAAVETLVMPEVAHDELRPLPGAFRDRANTYAILGLGLVGLAGSMLVGFLLVL